MLKEQTVSYTEHVVQRGPYHLYAREYPGEEPAIVLMHGFPDNLHLYDRLLPLLSPSHRVVTFPLVRNVARAFSQAFDNWLFRKMYWWQVGRFMREAADRKEFLPLLYHQFTATSSAQPAFFRLNEDLLSTVRDRTKRIPQMKAFKPPVRIIFGASDPYLNAGVARRFHDLFPTSELFLLPGARHYVQIDEPEQVAHLLLSTPRAREA
jgi:pimeloyl-ACP methyl ester carboxylesterase